MGSVGPVVLLVALVDGKNVATAQEKVLAPSYDVYAVGVGANAGVTWRFGRVAAPVSYTHLTLPPNREV